MPQDDAEAVRWFRKVAEQGGPELAEQLESEGYDKYLPAKV